MTIFVMEDKYRDEIICTGNSTYNLQKKIGEGGNGWVWLASRAGDSDKYAIKILKYKVSSKSSKNIQKKIERFKNEIEFCKGNEHDNIIKIYGDGIFKERLYYIMPFYQKTLRNLINENFGYKQLLNYSKQLCKSVQHIHAKGLIHRDIKPENILIDNDNNLILADFGMIHFVDSKLTSSNELMANRNYAAPEQRIIGDTNNITVKADIYAVGTIINELFTKKKPIGFEYGKIAEVYPMFTQLDNLINRCLSQNPTDRPEIDELVVRLDLINTDLSERMNLIKDFLYIPSHNETFLSNNDIDVIIEQASHDILTAKYIFEHASTQELEKYNESFHINICYNISKELEKYYFQLYLFDLCYKKFNYESNTYPNGYVYTPLSMKNDEHKRIYDEFALCLEDYKHNLDVRPIHGKILKLFASCCDYHCKEILHGITKAKEVIDDFSGSSIIYIVKKLRYFITDSEDINALRIEDEIEINWGSVDSTDVEDDNLFCSYQYAGEYEILNEFKRRFDIVFYKISNDHYEILFKSKHKYYDFKETSLKLAKPHYIFEGDVKDLLRIEIESNDHIQLKKLNSFDIINTLAKLLGFRNDY